MPGAHRGQPGGIVAVARGAVAVVVQRGTLARQIAGVDRSERGIVSALSAVSHAWNNRWREKAAQQEERMSVRGCN